MELREGIANLSRWSGWRRAGPAAGSLATHVVLGGAVFAVIASAPPMRLGDERSTLEIELIAEAMPAEGLVPTPPDARRAPPPSSSKDEVLPIEAPPRDARLKQASANSDAWDGAKSDEDGGVYRGQSAARSGVPLGLRSLLETDPCNPEEGRPYGNCSQNWGALMASGDKSVTPSYERLAELYPGFRPPGQRGQRRESEAQP